MNRRSLLGAGIVAAAGCAALAPAALAQTVELGQTTTPLVAPSCVKGGTLGSCKIVLTRTTGVQTTSDGVIYPTRVNQQGWIVSFTVGVSRLVANATKRAAIVKTLDASYGGAPELVLSVLKPGPNNTFTVVAQSGTYSLLPFLGSLIQEPLSIPPRFSSFTALPVVRGDVIGLTVPTWAPVLSYDLSTTAFTYRQSRVGDCNSPVQAPAQTAQTRTGQAATYGCYYAGTRIEYSATEITDTRAPSASTLRTLGAR